MIEFYPQIKLVHICAVFASGTLFALRGLAVQFGARWPRWAPTRYLSYVIDTTLLTAALMLMTILHQYPFVQAWLTVKLALVIVYIVLGALAINHARTRRWRFVCYVASLFLFVAIIAIAVTHHPLGILGRG